MNTYKYGIELETIAPLSKITQLELSLQRRGIWDYSGDGSLRYNNSQDGIEIKCAAPMTYEALKKELQYLDRILKNKRVTVNTSCGYHLHMSHEQFLEPLKLQRIIKLWITIEDFLFSTQSGRRGKNQYCSRKLNDVILSDPKPFPAQKEALLNSISGGRYFAINIAALKEHGSIEIRLHEGTVDREEIINWIDLMTLFYDYAISDSYSSSKVEDLFQTPISPAKILKIYDLLNVPDKLRTYYNKKVQRRLFTRLKREQVAAMKILDAKNYSHSWLGSQFAKQSTYKLQNFMRERYQSR